MIRRSHVTLVCMAAALASASTARAQTAPWRGFVSVNGGYQMTGNDFASTSTFRANVEDGSVTADYEVKGGPTFDVGGGVKLWRYIAVGVGVTRLSGATGSALNGSVPHPFFFNRPRPVTGDAVGLERSELAVHVQGQLIAPIGSRLQVTLFGGPSFFHVEQELVTGFTWSDTFPFDEASFSRATTSSATGSSVGFNAGADVAYFFTRYVGLGGVVQFSHGTVGLDFGESSPQAKLGGVKAGGGLRVRF